MSRFRAGCCWAGGRQFLGLFQTVLESDVIGIVLKKVTVDFKQFIDAVLFVVGISENRMHQFVVDVAVDDLLTKLQTAVELTKLEMDPRDPEQKFCLWRAEFHHFLENLHCLVITAALFEVIATEGFEHLRIVGIKIQPLFQNLNPFFGKVFLLGIV